MAFTRRVTNKDATWIRGWTADTLADLTTISATQVPLRGDVAFVISENAYYVWMDNDTWIRQGTTPVVFPDEYVVLSDGAIIPSPIDDGFGNFVYVSYTP